MNATDVDYPFRVSIPDDIPTAAVIVDRDGDTKVELSGAAYLHGHYRGWQSCLIRVSVQDGEIRIPEQTIISCSCSSFFTRGDKDGYADCAAAVARMMRRGVNPTDIVSACWSAYRPLRPAPPSPPIDGDAGESKDSPRFVPLD